LSDDKALVNKLLNISLSAFNFLKSLGIAELKFGNIKLNLVLTQPSKAFRVSDYRDVLDCGGTFTARLINSDGNPILGNNEVKTISIVK